MALKTETISSIQPFWHIDCPVCGGDDFVEYGTGGGVYCETCNTRFSVGQTAGDPGCIVTAHFEETSNILTHKGAQMGWRKALFAMGCFKRLGGAEKEPIIHACRTMKEPEMRGTYCTDDRGWTLAAKGRMPDKDVPAIVGPKRWRKLDAPLVTKEQAIAAFA